MAENPFADLAVSAAKAPDNPFSDIARETPAPAKPPSWLDLLTGSKAARDYGVQNDPRLALAAKLKGTTPQKEADTNEAVAGEFLKGIPIAGAAVPQTGSMTGFEKEHPIGTMAAQAAGATMVMAPLVAAAPEIFGAGPGQAILTRIVGSGLSGGGIAAADTAARGGGPEEIAQNAATGAAIGAAIPPIAATARGVFNGLRYAGRAVYNARNPEQAAFNTVADKMVEGGIDPAAIQQKYSPQPSNQLAGRGVTQEQTADIVSRGLNGESATSIAADYGLHPSTVGRYIQNYRTANPTPLNIMDMTKLEGEGSAMPVSRLGRAAANISPQPEMMQQLVDRQLNQPGRAYDIINQASAGGDLEATEAALQQKLATESGAAYKSFNQEPALATHQLNDLLEDPLFARAVQNARAQARAAAINENQQAIRAGNQPTAAVPSLEGDDFYTPQVLDKIQRQLRLTGENFTDPNAAAHAKDLRQIFLDRIEQFYPSFRGIRQNYASGMEAQKALAAGEDMTKNLGSQSRDVLKQFDAMTPAQQDLFRLGYARKLMDMVANKGEGADTVKQFSSDAVRQMIRRIYPKNVAEPLITRLSREGVTSSSLRDLFGNSTTARQILDQNKLMEGAQTAADAITGRWGNILANLANRLRDQIGEKSAGEILKVLSETDPSQVLTNLQRLSKAAKSSTERAAFMTAIGQARGVLPLLAGQYAAHRTTALPAPAMQPIP